LSLQEFFNNNATDELSKVQSQIDGVKEVMVQNIEKVLECGEKIELLVDKTDRLNHL
jgi:vesicle-associated membrane protein 7